MLQLPSEGDGVLILDDTGFAKPGHCSVGVARQYSGTLGKIGNCPVTVNCHSAERTMAWPVATRLYLPKGWASDADRRRKAKVPAAVAFRTEPQIALELLDRAWGVRWACVTVNAGSGDHPNFLDGLEAHRQRSVVAVRCDFTVTCLLLSFAGVRPPTSRPAPRASDFEPSDDRLPVPNARPRLPLGRALARRPQVLSYLADQAGADRPLVPGLPPRRVDRLLPGVRVVHLLGSTILFFRFTVAMRVAPLWKSRRHAHSVTY